jgi:3-methylfumaryl-CoA hydratase
MTGAAIEKIESAHLRQWIGHEETVSDVITADLVRKFCATFDMQRPASQIGERAPSLVHFCVAQPSAPTAQLGDDGHPRRGGFLPPVPLPRRMWAGSHVVFHRGLHIGDIVRRVSRIADVTLKQGHTGILCFVTVEHGIEVDGRAVLVESQDIVYRAFDGGQQKKPAEPAKAGSWQQRVVTPSPFLFRYSALTFNGHRIHYDRRYAVEVEHYPGLVVHGPLQATLLVNYAEELRGGPPSSFRFRSLSPLFDNDTVVLHAEEEGKKLKLWTAREGGPVAMTAEADWN